MYVRPLADCTSDRVGEVGGKAIGLASLLQHGFRVPPGFAVTTDAYHLAVRPVSGAIAELLQDTGTPEAVERVSAQIQALFTMDLLGDELRTAIEEAYRALPDKDDVPVAVRSSATAEDLAGASFAGQQDTHLWVRGANAVCEHIVRCWASLFTARAISYRARVGVPVEDLAMGVVVQEMVAAESSGVMMTLEPTRGDRSVVYIESAFGLGEAIVRGEVDVDRFSVEKDPLRLRSEHIGHKESAYHFDPETGTVRFLDVAPADQTQRSLSADEVLELATLGVRIEEAFSRPMDVEWAIAPGRDGRRQFFLLQARPETVWSSRGDATDDRRDDWDPLHSSSPPGLHWTTSNVREAMPGVVTPMAWSLWGRPANRAGLETACAMGALSRAESRVPDRVEDWFIRILYGAVVLNVEYVARLGDRMPGTTGEDTVRSLFGRVPEGMEFKPTRRRYPTVAWRFPLLFATTPGRVRRLVRDYDAWWQASIDRLDTLDYAGTLTLFEEAARRFEEAVVVQCFALLGVCQPLHDALSRVAEKTGHDSTSLTTVTGGAEIAVISDIWRASRREISVEDVVRRHGFHGPMEGEVASRVWREDASPLRALIEQYAKQPDDQDPGRRDAERRRQHQALEREVLAAMPRTQRPAVALLLRLARTRLALRGVAKRSFLQALDVTRASLRRLGEQLVQDGRLRDADDIFYLTRQELSALPPSLQELIDRRRARREEYQGLTLPAEWKGMPQPVHRTETEALEVDVSDGTLRGIGVSAGVAEGTARVITAEEFASVEPGEILVAPTTDPSWCSVMFISSALIVDIGGALSHAAVVARELGIPCVVNTRTGTRTLRTGDRIRVDGQAGTVVILERAVPEASTPTPAG